MVAVSIGQVLAVPFYVSLWRTARRIQRAEHVAGTTAGVGAIAGLIALNVVASIVAGIGPSLGLYAAAVVAVLGTVMAVAAVMQRRLNVLWRRADDVEEV